MKAATLVPLEEYLRTTYELNPRNRRASVYTTDGSRLVKDGVLRATHPDLELKLAELFPD